MKNWTMVFAAAIALNILPAALPAGAKNNSLADRSPSKYHDFLLKDGRSFRGRIVAYDHHTGIVKIECANKRLVKTAPDVFDEADQVRINEWHLTQCFQSKSRLKVSARRKSVKGSKWSTISIDIPGLGSSGGSSGYTRNIHYDILLENRSVVPLRNMTVEYCIFYSCNKMKGSVYDKFRVSELSPKSKKEVRTARYVSNRKHSSMFNPGSKTVVDGVWIRITHPLSNGRKVTRDYCRPDHLSKNNEWAYEDVLLQ